MEKLNRLLSSFLNQYGIDDMGEFLFTSRLSKIIYDHPRNIDYNYKIDKLSIEQSIKYSKEFLTTLHRKYARELNLKRNHFIFAKDGHGSAFSDYDYETNEKVIYIPYEQTLQDAFTLTHEIVHVTTLSSIGSITRNVFCEVFSFWAEMLQRDYFKKQNIKNYNINDLRQVNALYELNCINMFQTMLVDEYLNSGYITVSNFMSLLNYFSCDEIEAINRHLSNNLATNDFDILFQNRYVIGYPVACYLYEYFNSKKEFVTLNDSINDYDILDFLDYIELDCKNSNYVELTEESYQKIEDSYVKYLKRI